MKARACYAFFRINKGVVPCERSIARRRARSAANLTVSVTYVVSDRSATYEQYGDLEVAVLRLIDPRVTSGAKTIFGQYDAVRAI